MGNQLLPPADPQRASSGLAPGVRSAGFRPCPQCGALTNVNASVCPECGETLPTKARRVRCSRCHKQASSNLVICPHCGRELHPAPPRLLTWGTPVILAGLLIVVLASRLDGNPLDWAQNRLDRVLVMVNDLGSRLQPDVTISTIPADQAADNVLASQPSQSQVQAGEAGEPPAAGDSSAPSGSEQEAAPAAALPTEAATEAATEAVPPTATPLPTDTPAPTAAPTDTPAPTATTQSTPEPTATATVRATDANTATATVRSTSASLRPSATATVAPAVVAAAAITSSLTLPTPTPTISEPTPAPTATPAPQTYTVRAGDTLFEIALANDLDLDELLAANNLSSDDVYTIQPGDELIIPDPNAAPPPTATSTATPVVGQTYTVRPGDTLMGIAQRFGISTQALMDANGLTISQARTLRSGQELIIPGASTAPEPTATPRPAATATAPPAASTAKIRLDAPILRTPENKTAVSCSASDALVWQPVPFIQSADIYVVHLGYVNGIDASGNEQIVWVIAQQRPANVTSWNLDNGLCGLASLEFGRQWRWYVDVAEKGPDGTLTPVSQPSEMWGFSWQ